MLFEIDDKSVVKIADFLEEIGTLYDLLIYLFDNSMRSITSAQTQINFFKAITVLRIIISNMKGDIPDQSEEKKKKSFAEQQNILSNAEMLLEQIDQLSKNNMISRDEKFFDALTKIEKSALKKPQKNQFLS